MRKKKKYLQSLIIQTSHFFVGQQVEQGNGTRSQGRRVCGVPISGQKEILKLSNMTYTKHL